MAWVTADEVLARWLGEDAPSPDTVTQWVSDAETLIKFEYPDIQDRIDSRELPFPQVQLVVARVVIRGLRNPDNARSNNIGPTGITYAGDNPGGLQLTADDRALLGASPSQVKQTAFTIDTTPSFARPGYWSAPDTWTTI